MTMWPMMVRQAAGERVAFPLPGERATVHKAPARAARKSSRELATMRAGARANYLAGVENRDMVLEFVRKHAGGVRLGSISEALYMSRETARKHLLTLADDGMVERDAGFFWRAI